MGVYLRFGCLGFLGLCLALFYKYYFFLLITNKSKLTWVLLVSSLEGSVKNDLGSPWVLSGRFHQNLVGSSLGKLAWVLFGSCLGRSSKCKIDLGSSLGPVWDVPSSMKGPLGPSWVLGRHFPVCRSGRAAYSLKIE